MLSAKYLSLLAGVVQQSALVLIIRYSKTIARGDGDDASPLYLNSVAVASAEVFKLCLSLTLEFINAKNQESELGGKGGRVRHLRSVLTPMLICSDRESVKLIVPALMYLIQNNLLFVALANLSVPMYQVTNQGKLLTTALLSRVMLKKQISCMQYVSIALLGFGVAFIHLSAHFMKEKEEGAGGSAPAPSEVVTDQNQMLGLAAVLVCCVTSSISGVYFEFVLKKSPSQLSVHCRNFHLASWSLILAMIHICTADAGQVMEYGLFHGFDIFVVLVVIAQGMTGFLVSMIIKYADAVLKGFAIAVAAVFGTLLAVPLFGDKIGLPFVAGAAMVGAAVKMYSKFEVKQGGKTVDVSKVDRTSSTIDKGEEELGLLSKGESKTGG
ncbi:hypothetical protein ACHAWF_005192 [Thalassiosira exigua]